MKLGFIVPTYVGEKRVALLPEHIGDFANELFVERGFGLSMGVSDEEYVAKGCTMLTRQEIFASCDAIFCLKLIQPSDYDLLREGQMIIGWTHPTGSGREFYDNVAVVKKLVIVDLDNIYPSVYYQDKKVLIPFIPKNFIWKNSFLAGVASVQHALLACGMYPDSSTRVAVLANGNVSQGAYNCISRYGVDVRLFYRKTMSEFYDTLADYDIVINGIEVDTVGTHILSQNDLSRLKRGCLLIDSAADAGNAIEGTHYTTLVDPIYEEKGLLFYEVNNAPSLLYRRASLEISKSFSQWIYTRDVHEFKDLLK